MRSSGTPRRPFDATAVATRGVALLVAVSGCGRFGFGAGEPPDAGADAAEVDAPCTGSTTWSSLQPVAEVNTPASEQGGQISPDGLSLYFHSDLGGNDDLYVATRPDRASPFGAAAPIAELATPSSEHGPSITGDGLELFFDSNRSGTNCIYRTTRADLASPWGAPTQLVALCGTQPAVGPYVTADGLRLYYDAYVPGSMTTEGTLMMTSRAARTDSFPAGSPIAELQASDDRGYPALSSDELTIYFESAPGGGKLELYQASRPDRSSPFDTPVLVPNVTGLGSEDGSISADGLELFFASSRAGGAGGADLYVARRDCPGP